MAHEVHARDLRGRGVIQSFWVPGPLPGLNEILAARGITGKRGAKGRRYDGYNELKQKWQAVIALSARAYGLRPVTRAHIYYFFYERDRRRDPSNFVSGGVKIIEDALVGLRVLPGDGWSTIAGYQPLWSDEDPTMPGVAVVLVSHSRDEAPQRFPELSEALDEAEKARETWKTWKTRNRKSPEQTSSCTSSGRSGGSSKNSPPHTRVKGSSRISRA